MPEPQVPEVYYGSVPDEKEAAKEKDWRSRQREFDSTDDDAEVDESPEDVVGMLGFDPREIEEPGEDEPETASATDQDGGTVRSIDVHGLECMIETPKGGVRSGTDYKGRDWTVQMPADYGYVEGFKGADGDSLDCYVGPSPASDWVYVVDQARVSNFKKFDEHKVMLGFDTLGEARRAYAKAHHLASDVLMGITPMRIGDFKYWLATANMKKPGAETA